MRKSFHLYDLSTLSRFLDVCSMLSSDDDQKLSEFLSTKYKAKLCEITGQVTGITFKDVDRKWLCDDVYMYIAKVVTKTISFDFKLTVTFRVSKEDYIIHNTINQLFLISFI